jgi:Domain of unknown function (DUF4185)
MKRFLIATLIIPVIVVAALAMMASAAAGGAPLKDKGNDSGISLTYRQDSSVKIEQIIGDCDWAIYDQTMTLGAFDVPGSGIPGVCMPTVSQTVSISNVLGNGLGYSFEHNGRLIFLFGDTFGANDTYLNEGFVNSTITGSPLYGFPWAAHEPIAWSETRRPEEGLLLNFFMSGGIPVVVQPPCYEGQPSACPADNLLPMGADDVPNSGISVGGKIYIIVNTNADLTADDPHVGAYSVLVRFDEETNTFYSGRTISQSYYPLGHLTGTPGHFVFTSLHGWPPDPDTWQRDIDKVPQESGNREPGVLIYGQGQYRASDIYLSYIPASAFWSGVDKHGNSATRYFAGFKKNRPTWSKYEQDAVPVVVDNPIDCTPWPKKDCVSGPTVGNASVIYSHELGLWLMTYDGGRQTKETCPETDTNPPNPPDTVGIYFSYASAPWGPWSTPQLIFNAGRDNGFGTFIFRKSCNTPGPAGPTIGIQNPNNPNTNYPLLTNGGPFAPFMIERFTEVKDDTLKIYYTLSTWNPDTVVKMRSEFKIERECTSKH